MNDLLMDDLPPLRDVVRQYGLEPRRSLGQNFLFDLNLTARIAREAGPLADKTVVEIGPGPGGLTRALLAAGAGRVIAIERDERFLPALADIGAHYPGKLHVHHADALTADLAALTQNTPFRIVANLPYNVGTELLVRWLETPVWPPLWESLTLMFQREVAERIAATPEQREDYGRLGVLCGWRADVRILFDVPPAAFTPPPKVTSSVVQLTPKPQPLPCDLKTLSRVTQAAFSQRRKMVRQSLKSLGGNTAALLAAAGIDPTARAETISVAGFVALAHAYYAQRSA